MAWSNLVCSDGAKRIRSTINQKIRLVGRQSAQKGPQLVETSTR